MKRLIIASILLAISLFYNSAYAGRVAICHCPPGIGGAACSSLYVGEAASTVHLSNHKYDFEGECGSKERTVCHCPTQYGGDGCYNISIYPQNHDVVYNTHFPEHPYDHERECTEEEIEEIFVPPGGNVGGFTVPKSGGSNWKEN